MEERRWKCSSSWRQEAGGEKRRQRQAGQPVRGAHAYAAQHKRRLLADHVHAVSTCACVSWAPIRMHACTSIHMTRAPFSAALCLSAGCNAHGRVLHGLVCPMAHAVGAWRPQGMSGAPGAPADAAAAQPQRFGLCPSSLARLAVWVTELG